MAFDANNKRIVPGDVVTVACDPIEEGEYVLMATKHDHEGNFKTFYVPKGTGKVTATVLAADSSSFGDNLLLELDGLTLALNSALVTRD